MTMKCPDSVGDANPVTISSLSAGSIERRNVNLAPYMHGYHQHQSHPEAAGTEHIQWVSWNTQPKNGTPPTYTPVQSFPAPTHEAPAVRSAIHCLPINDALWPVLALQLWTRVTRRPSDFQASGAWGYQRMSATDSDCPYYRHKGPLCGVASQDGAPSRKQAQARLCSIDQIL
jgi:hypothetical protein